MHKEVLTEALYSQQPQLCIISQIGIVISVYISTITVTLGSLNPTPTLALLLAQVYPHMTETICSQTRTSRIVVDALTGVLSLLLFPFVPTSCAPFLIFKLLLTSRNNNTSERGVMGDAQHLQRATNRSAVLAPKLLCLRSRQLHVS